MATHFPNPSLSQIQEFAGNYSDRQGLRVVPMALAVLVQAFPRWFPDELFGMDSMLLALAVGILGYWLVGLYYRRRFGHVEELPYEGMPLTVQILLVAIAFFSAITVDLSLHPPVFVSGLVVAGWLAITAWPSRHVRRQYLWIALVMALLSFAQLTGVSQADTARACGFWFAVGLLLAGIRDHFAFIRIFPPLERQHE